MIVDNDEGNWYARTKVIPHHDISKSRNRLSDCLRFLGILAALLQSDKAIYSKATCSMYTDRDDPRKGGV